MWRACAREPAGRVCGHAHHGWQPWWAWARRSHSFCCPLAVMQQDSMECLSLANDGLIGGFGMQGTRCSDTAELGPLFTTRAPAAPPQRHSRR